MEKPECPACGSADRVTKNGKSYGRQRWICRNTRAHDDLLSFTVGPVRKRGPGRKPKRGTTLVRVELDSEIMKLLGVIDGRSRSEKIRNAIVRYSSCGSGSSCECGSNKEPQLWTCGLPFMEIDEEDPEYHEFKYGSEDDDASFWLHRCRDCGKIADRGFGK